ncbi:hypothetical protein H4S01_003825 [Coemansia sp. RSA 2610]|nr:hypothetical protein H4S01_003825 [Coemansia sp. RSA 2610]
MAVAHAAKSIDQSKQQKQQALSGTLGAMSEASDDEDSVVFRALHTMRPRRDFIGPKQSSQRPARRIRGRRHRGTAESVGNRANRPPLAQLAAEEDWSSCSSSIAEDVWTG